MKNSAVALALALTAAALAGCESTGRGGDGAAISVNRTHIGQPIARGEIRVEPDVGAAVDPGFGQLIAPVERELTRLGWTLARGNAASEQVAIINITPGAGTTELRVRLRRRSDASFFWDGRATGPTPSDTGYPTRAALIDRLAQALFRDFPGESGRTIRVR